MKPTILFIMHMPPPVHGAAMMGQYIHDSKLINETFDCHYINPSLSASVASVGKVSWSKFVSMLKNTWSIFKAVDRYKPALIYYTPTTHSMTVFRDLLVVGMLKIKGQKMLLHLHNKGVKDFASRHPLSRLAYKIIFCNSKVILLAKELYPDIEDYVSRENVYLCPNGVPINNAEFSRKLTHSPYRFLFLSNMIEDKGVIDLLKACAIIKQKGKSFVCQFVGKWSSVTEERFNSIVHELGIKDVVEYRGPKYGTDKSIVLQESDALVFPTYYHGEAFSLVLLEAMDFALPCISTREGGIPSLIDDGNDGFLIKSREIEALGTKMAWLADHPEDGLKMGKCGRNRFLKLFTVKTFEHRLLDILSSEVENYMK